MPALQDHQHHTGCAEAHEDDKDSSGRRLLLALILIASFALFEVAGGILSGSLALLADAGHMVTDAAALGLALSATWLARRPATARFPFGLKRAQVLAAFVNGLALIGIVALLLVEAANRFGSPREIDAPLMLSVAAVGLAANFAAFFLLHPKASKNVNVRGAMLHVAADIFGSVAAILSALVIMAKGWVVIDPILTVVVCLLILRSAVPLIVETATILLQAAPAEISESSVRSALTASTAVVDVRAVRAWQLTPQETYLSLEAIVPRDGKVEDMLAEIHEVLRDQFGIADATVQLEPSDVVALRRDKTPNKEDRRGLAE